VTARGERSERQQPDDAGVDRSARPRREARISALIAVLALVAGLAVAPPWQSGDGIPEGFAGRLISGDLERLVDGGWGVVREGELIRDGATVRSVSGAELAVPGGSLLLGPGTRSVLDDPLRLDAGAVLTVVDADRRVRIGALVATGRGSWRVDAGPTERVAVYDGGVGIRPAVGDGEGLAVGRLDQAALLSGRLPSRALPLRYSADDAWDVRWLAGAVAVDREIEQVARGLRAEYGDTPRPQDFYAEFRIIDEELLDAITPIAGAHGENVGPVATVVVHATVARMIMADAGVTADDAVAEIDALLRDGATWGLVLARRGLGPGDLLRAIDLALEEAPPPAPPAADADADAPDPDGPDDPIAPPSPPDDPPPPGDDNGDDPGDPGGVVDDIVDETEETAEEVVDDLTGLIDDLIGDGDGDDTSGGLLDDAVGLIDDIIGIGGSGSGGVSEEATAPLPS
jgi:hypothetical protein